MNLETSLNGICPYFTMFPLDFPYQILKRHASPEQWVIDPFCGRGTTNFAGRLLQLNSIGIDSSPVAVAVARAKVAAISPQQIVNEAKKILESTDTPKELPVGEFWRWAFHEKVLRALCILRESLLADCNSPARGALRGILLGGLHGQRGKYTQSYFSNQCQRTYAPKPRYATAYWKTHNLEPPEVGVLEIIKRRANAYYSGSLPSVRAHVVLGDSRDDGLFNLMPQDARAAWVITSPPYYGMKTYIPDQWLRYWFVGGPDQVSYSMFGQLGHNTPSAFADQLRLVWQNLEKLCEPSAHLVVRFGALNDRKVDGVKIIKDSLSDTRWRLITRRSAGSASAGRRQVSHFGTTQSTAIEEFDYWATLAG